jgi:ABC-type multidrug transport system fused ATPase/permease subunit
LTARKKANVIKTIGRSLRLTFTHAKKTDIFLAYLWLLTAVTSSVVIIFERNMLNDAARIIMGENYMFFAALRWLVLWTALSLLNHGISMLSNRSNRRMWSYVGLSIKEGILTKMAKIKYEYFDYTETYKKLEFIKGDFNWKISEIMRATFNIVFVVIQLVTISVIIINENWVIAVIIAVAAVPSFILNHLQTEGNYQNEQWNSHEMRFQTYVSWVLFKRPYLKEMRYGNLYDHMNEKFDKSSVELFKKRMALMRKFTAYKGFANFIGWAAVAVSLVIISRDIIAGLASIGSFLLVYRSVQTMQNNLASLFGDVVMIGSEGRFIEDFAEVMEYEDEKLSVISGRLPDIDIEVKNVSFRYPNTDRLVLKNVSTKIRQGEKIAIVGENGSGKSTFVSLLCGLYPPNEGEILVNGTGISDNLGLLREKVSCTFQHFGKFEMSVRDNVKIGDLGTEHGDDDIIAALKQSGAYELVSTYKDGIDAHLGTMVKGGTQLSGGEWQKIAMARNLLKKNARVVILDEPTAALDPLAEARLYRDFNGLMEDRTVLLISHRLGSTRLADRILVFHEGEIIEEGTHEELVAADGMYNRMYNAQAQWYI